MYLLTGFLPKPAISLQSSPFHACDCTHDRITSLMHVKKTRAISVYDTHCLGYWNRENERKNKNIKFSSWWIFCLTFVNLLLAWMLYFHVWLLNKGMFLVSSEYYTQFGIYQTSRVSSNRRKATLVMQGHIQYPVQHLKWSFLWK